MTPIFDWSYALEILPTLGAALVVTIQATVLGMLVAVTLGLALALLRLPAAAGVMAGGLRDRVRAQHAAAGADVLPVLCPAADRLAHVAAGHPECWRWACTTPPIAPRCTAPASKPCPGADRGRHRSEPAALAHGGGRGAAAQAIPPVVPALGNYLVAMFKDTPLLSAITVVELLQQSKMLGSATFRYTEPLTWWARCSWR